jgi:tripartite-type tricarboxylate transporter receptor subunit TctC
MDVLLRIIQQPLQEALKQALVIDFKPGANSLIGMDFVAKAAPDGYTFLIAPSSAIAINPIILPKMPFDVQKDLAPVAQFGTGGILLVANPNARLGKLQDMVDFAKANPGKLTLASPGTGSTPHLAGELFKRMAGIEMTHVPYRGAGPVLNDLIPGRVDVYFASGSLLENARAGQIRALAVTGAKREPAAPDLPTIAEAGLPGFEVSSWQALFVPANTPPEIVAKINADALAALADAAVKGRLEQLGYTAAGSTPKELATLLKSEIHKWGAVIKDAGISIN